MDKKTRKKNEPYDVMALPLALTEMVNPITDPQGMWTGVPLDPNDEPIQDNDDL